MDAERYQQVKVVLDAALELAPGERSAFLDEKCADDSELRIAVEALLAAHDKAQSFLEHAGPVDATTVTVKGPDGTPERIGRYKILEQLGEGGMGVVYLAEQVEPIRRRVALKLIKLGMDSKTVIARFEAERQALAIMNHPNVAKVFDAGTTEQGRPFFVMEYVKGVPITVHCDRQRLTTKERLRLFMQACEGVQHAHQKGIIHRDLKPSNVLVAIESDKAVPKIIDFGVAKAMEHRLTEQMLFTQLGQIIGTPEYMSPEQAEMTEQDIDTRTDVYSLGVILYELLVGALPFDPKELRKAGFDEIRRRIREEEPSKPSTRVSSLGEASTGSAKKRQTDPASLIRQLRGDLDWITMRSLEKDRTRRYGSANDLAADIRRNLRHEPVEASPPSATYRLGRFARRHRLAVILGSLLGFAVLAGALGTSVGLLMSIRAQRASHRAEREAAASRDVAEAVSAFLISLFYGFESDERRGELTAWELVDRGAKKLERELPDQPLLRARLLNIMGEIYLNIGQRDEAIRMLEESLALRESLLGENHTEVAESLASVARTYSGHRGDSRVKACAMAKRALKIRETALGPSHVLVAESLHDIATLRCDEDNRAELLERVLAIKEHAVGPRDPSVAVIMLEIARLREAGVARHYIERAADILEEHLGSQHPTVVEILGPLGHLRYQLGDYDHALVNFQRALSSSSCRDAQRHRKERPGEPVLESEFLRAVCSGCLSGLALVHAALGNRAVALHFAERNLEEARAEEQLDSFRDFDVADALRLLGRVYIQNGELARAQTLYEEATNMLQDDEELADSGALPAAYLVLARLHGAQGEPQKARDFSDRAARAIERDECWLLGVEACNSVVFGEDEEALRLLRRRLELDCDWPVISSLARWDWFNRTPIDCDFVPLRGHREFEAIVAEVKKRIGKE